MAKPSKELTFQRKLVAHLKATDIPVAPRHMEAAKRILAELESDFARKG